MKPIVVGYHAEGKHRGQPLFITPEMRQQTHTHIIGGSGKGKSKALEFMNRQEIDHGHGFCVTDWHGTLYHHLLAYCAEHDVGMPWDWRRLVLLNPADPKFVVGFNPFMNRGGDIATEANNRVQAIMSAWQMQNADTAPTFERVCRIVTTFAAEQRELVFNVTRLLNFGARELREYALVVAEDFQLREDLEWLQSIRPNDWTRMVLSTQNRFARFLGSTGIRRFMGLKDEAHNLNLRQIMDEGHILLVNLGASPHLDRESARLFATLLLHEFFQTAMERAHDAVKEGSEPKPYVLYLDEFQRYITPEIADMLDEVRKGGLHVVLAHQNLGQIAQDPHLYDSVIGNARLRFVFGGLSFKTAELLSQEMFLPEINTRQVTKQYYGLTHRYEEELRTSYSRSGTTGVTRGASWGETDTTTEGRGSSKTAALGVGRSTSRGTTTGRTTTSGSGTTSGVSGSESAGLAESSSHGEALLGPARELEAAGLLTPGNLLMTVSDGQSAGRFSTDGQSWAESDSDFESESESLAESEGEAESTSLACAYGENESQSYGYAASRGGSLAASESEGWSETVSPTLIPYEEYELRGEAERSRDEKVSRIVERIKFRPQRFGYFSPDAAESFHIEIPWLRAYTHSQDYLALYESEVQAVQNALPASETDQRIAESRAQFLAQARAALAADQPPPEAVNEPSSAGDILNETSPRGRKTRSRAQKPKS